MCNCKSNGGHMRPVKLAIKPKDKSKETKEKK